MNSCCPRNQGYQERIQSSEKDPFGKTDSPDVVNQRDVQ